MAHSSYIVAGTKPWNRRVFHKIICHYPGVWKNMESREELTPFNVNRVKPRYIFFLHWSWPAPDEIVDNYECVCFHMADVPYGRGGSPLQNLISRGYRETKLSALRMIRALDAGPVYVKQNLSLEGNAEEIYIRATVMAAQMIKRIIGEQPEPVPQYGEIVQFKRRKPAQSRIPKIDSLEAMHDFIRMLDAHGYRRAFLDYEGFRFELSRPALYDGRIVADVSITKNSE